MKLTVLPAVAAGFCLAMAVPSVKASTWNQRTIMTFNEPVEVPGRVLSPGTYVFKLANSQSDRNIVQVYTKNMKHEIGTFLTVPDYRMRPAGKTIVRFEERAEGSPEAIRAWFYPGDNYGHEFVYPKTEALKLAKANNLPVASMEDQEYNGPNMQTGHIRAVRPTGEEIEVIEIFGNGPQTTSNAAPGQQGYGNQSSGSNAHPGYGNNAQPGYGNNGQQYGQGQNPSYGNGNGNASQGNTPRQQ
jgi:hypothetical protein